MHPLIERVMDLIDQIQAKFDDLVSLINGALDSVPFFLDWIVDKLQDKWNEFVAKWDEFWAAQELFWTNWGSPDTLSSTSQAWTTSVGSPATSASGTVDRALLAADDEWTGQAADSYFPRANLHKTAMERVQANFVSAATDGLSTLRGALTTFYTTLAGTLTGFIAAMIGAAAASGTIVGIPAGIVIAIGAVAVAAGAFYWAGTTLKGECTNVKTSLIASINDKTGYPGGSWPPGAVLTA